MENSGSALHAPPKTPNLPHPRHATGHDMYIRATKTHTADGRPAYGHRLVRSEREGDKVRQKTLLNLGTDYDVPREHWREVAELAETLLHGQPPLLEPAPGIRAAAESIVARLRARGLRADAGAQPGDGADVATVDLDTLEHENPRSAGCERLCLKALDDLDFAAILHRLGVKGRDGRIARALVVARMAHPASERETSRWLRHDSATAELLELEGDDKALSRKTLYRVGDLLWRRRALIQKGLFERERDLLGIPDVIVLHDLTNVHYHGRHDGRLRRFGRSKQKRDDCPLVTLALALDSAGFPRSAEILPGNASEPDTLRDALERLEAECGSGGARPTVVIDAGIASEANIAWLNARGCNWIAVSRGGRPPPPEGAPGAVLVTVAEHEVRAWRLAEKDGEARLYVVSEGRKATEDSILARKRSRFEAALDALHRGLSVKGRLKRHDRILESVGRLKERFAGVSGHYEIRVEKAPTGANAKALRYSRRKAHADADERAGAYVLRTSHTDWDIETVLRTYWRITDIEATFRSLKSELGLRPVHHRLDRRIAAHLMIAVFAFHGVQLIRTRLAARGITRSWTAIRESMRTWVRVTTRLAQTDGTLVVNRQDTRPAAEVAETALAAGVKPALDRRRIRIPN